jgi:hypothetical protein
MYFIFLLLLKIVSVPIILSTVLVKKSTHINKILQDFSCPQYSENKPVHYPAVQAFAIAAPPFLQGI